MNWRYKKLSEAWGESKPPPNTLEEASRLLIHTLHKNQQPNADGLFSFFGLPFPRFLDREAPPLADGVKFELHTLPVRKQVLTQLTLTMPTNSISFKFFELTWWKKVDAKAVADGDTVTVYVSTLDARESSRVPRDVQLAAVEWNKADAEKNYTKEDELNKQIKKAGYR